jgi:hypothetical protein
MYYRQYESKSLHPDAKIVFDANKDLYRSLCAAPPEYLPRIASQYGLFEKLTRLAGANSDSAYDHSTLSDIFFVAPIPAS